ncbi:hypothetical protein RchiOBHm_Chr7g0214091 [Rosa chinensis]|uniref:Non-specific serine/threonine protein kinase n=1 Tax=Rosa chinensis TaxID=74649 RepID=A0A2P6PB50_ROSCH|nr:hypothetical protein RchiOBHm_Chr7g0214091 [Rosa chinensis]
MQKIVAVILLLLFLSLLSLPVSIFCFYSDLRNSLLLRCLAPSNSNDCLLNCGSSSNVTFFNHFFIGDFNSGSGFVSTGRSISVTNNKIPPPNSPSPYHTARVLTTASSYSLSARKIGTHLSFVKERFKSDWALRKTKEGLLLFSLFF